MGPHRPRDGHRRRELVSSPRPGGVISWSIAAWLFAVNRTFLAAYFRKETTPIKALFTRDGLAIGENMIEVLRWGLWMSPIIKSFLRPMGEPTWYNQDGAIRTLIAIFRDATLTPEAFRAWSLQVFVALLAYDAVRILIWLDHMGLRVATLVNLSFLGMDKLERRLARFLAPAATARCIPEAVKRFATWGPLLIPYYIPVGGLGLRLERGRGDPRPRAAGIFASFAALPVSGTAVCSRPAPSSRARPYSRRPPAGAGSGHRPATNLSLSNSEYYVVLREDGEIVSQARNAATTSAGDPTTTSTPPDERCSWSTPAEPGVGPLLAGDRQLSGGSLCRPGSSGTSIA